MATKQKIQSTLKNQPIAQNNPINQLKYCIECGSKCDYDTKDNLCCECREYKSDQTTDDDKFKAN